MAAGGAPLRTQLAGSGPVVAVAGCLDASSADPVLYRLLRVIAPATVVVVDLAALDGLDAAGVGTLLAARDRARRLGGDLCLRGVPDRAAMLLDEVAPAGDPLTVSPGPDRVASAVHEPPPIGQPWAQPPTSAAAESSPQARSDDSAAVIGQAQGILMERHGLGAEEAFERLRAAGHALRRPLHLVAATIVQTRVDVLDEEQGR